MLLQTFSAGALQYIPLRVIKLIFFVKLSNAVYVMKSFLINLINNKNCVFHYCIESLCGHSCNVMILLCLSVSLWY